MNEPDWENIRGLRIIGWALDLWGGRNRPHRLALTGKNFEVVGYCAEHRDKNIMVRELGTNSPKLYEVHFSWVILG